MREGTTVTAAPDAHRLHGAVVQLHQLVARGRADHLEDLDQLVCLRAELLAEALVLPLLVPLGAQREAGAACPSRRLHAPTGKQRLHARVGLQRLQQLAQDAAHRPHVDLRVVVLLQQDQLRRAVPARHHVLRELPLESGLAVSPQAGARHVVLEMIGARDDHSRFLLLAVLVVHLTGESKVNDLELAFVVDENVGRLQIAVHNVRTLSVTQKQKEHLHVEQAA